MVAMARLLGSGATGQGPIHNALVESFVIHMRGVLDFLCEPRSLKPDDVVARDYFDDPQEWAAIQPPLSELLAHARKRAGKEVAHLTYERLKVTPEEKLWPFLEIEKEIMAVLRVFIAKVPRERLAEEWLRQQTTA